MRRRARSGFTDDSLDLLLDTVANMFGGIMFIAMLLAILTAARSATAPGEAGQSAASVYEALRLRTEVRAAAERVRRLERAAEDAAAAAQSDLPEDAMRLKAMRDRLDEDLADARERLEQAERIRDRLGEKFDSTAEIEQTASAEIERLREKRERLQGEIEKALDARRSVARLPVTRRTDKLPVHMALSHGRLFVFHKHEGRPFARPVPNKQDVRIEDFIGGNQRVTLRDDGGFPVTEQIERHPRWRNLVRSVNHERWFISVAVYPDSYREFLQLKTAVLSAGFEYNIVPLEAGDPLVLVPAEGFTTQ